MKKSIKTVVIFCGAHATPTYLELAREVGKALAQHGFAAVTGGGPGMMSEVNKSARLHGGESYGICIRKPEESPQRENFTHFEIYDSFDERHKKLLSYGDAFLALPGGLGTIYEAIEITQRKKFKEIPMETPLIFVGKYFERLTKVFLELANEGFITDVDSLYRFAPTVNDMIVTLKEHRDKPNQ